MGQTPAGRTTPRDFFLWIGAMAALYGTVIALITLLFDYVNRAFPDALAGFADPYGGSVRFAMATLFVLVPTMVFLLHTLRRTVERDPSKEGIWIRRWSLYLTLFIASGTVVIDLITLINTFLGGEVTTRFILKVIIVLLVAIGISLHFLADLKGYWFHNEKKTNAVGAAVIVLVLAVIVSGFFIIGTPGQVRLMRYDAQKVSDLQNLQYQVLNYWQTKKALPKSLGDLTDPLSGYGAPSDPQSGAAYGYTVTGPLSFQLCANFNRVSTDTAGQGTYPSDMSYPMPAGMSTDDTWQHSIGETCFTRTIDPQRYAVPALKPL